MLSGLAGIADKVRRTEVSAEQLVLRSLDTIKAKNSSLNAFCAVFDEAAVAEARRCDREAAAGRFRGPLHGIPVGVKDLFLTKGRRTARGSRAFRDFVPEESAPVVERIEAAGAIVLGKTTTTEFGWSGSSVSELYGPTRNPWAPALTSGGSSSGSAVAVASGMVPFALGSDGGGSVRIPASFCGIFAMKGSLARIPTYPWSATEMLSHAGPITRTAADSALLFNILKGPDPRDHNALPDDGLDYLESEVDIDSLRIGFAPTLFDKPVDPEVAGAIERSIERIAQTFDIEVAELHPGWRDPIRIFETLWVAGRGVAYGRSVADGEQAFGAGFGALVRAAQDYDLADYLDAMKDRARFAAEVHGLFEELDLLLMPTVPILPFEAELEAPADYPGDSSVLPWTAWTPFTYPFNLTGNPAASLPVGSASSGLPIGLQVVGRRYSDHRVLAFCRALEALFPVRLAEETESVPAQARRGASQESSRNVEAQR